VIAVLVAALAVTAVDAAATCAPEPFDAARIVLTKLTGPPGDDRFLLRGRLTVPSLTALAGIAMVSGLGVTVADRTRGVVVDARLPPGTLEKATRRGWRMREAGTAVDASGALPDGTPLTGAAELRAALLKQPDAFVRTLSEKMLIYALGRGLQSYDQPVVRSIVRDAAGSDYRFSSLVLGIVKSDPFQMKMKAVGSRQ